MEIMKMTALELGAQIQKGNISSVEAVKAVIDAAAKSDSKINAYITLNEESAIAKAEEIQKKIDAGKLTSRLAGVPVAVKDNICTSGIKTTCGSKILGDFTPPYNATVIEKLEKAGAIILGKTNMDEFAMGSTCETSYYGSTKNPFDINRVSGGSSGGSAAAVASGEAFIALGSDTGGSIRQPASYCGVTGFKPTYGTVSRYGLIAYASSLDQIGPIGRDVADCAAIMDVISGKDTLDGTSLDNEYPNYTASLSGEVKGLKIGLPTQCFDRGLDDDVRRKVLEAADKLKDLGADVQYFDLPFFEFVIPTYYIIASAEASSNLSRFDGVKYGYRSEEYESLTELYNNTRSEGFGDEVKKRILLGTFVLSSGYFDAYYKKALKVKAVIKTKFDEVFKEFDAILCPTAPSTAPLLGKSLTDSLKMYLSDIYTVSANLAGLPALSLPCGFDSLGMPVGAQIIGPALSDAAVLNIGHAYQRVTDFHKRIAEVRV